MKDYYEILGVSPNSDEVVIRAAYKAMMMKFHPDTNKSAGAAEIARDINEAFAVLSDTVKRGEYDSKRSGKDTGQVSPSSRPTSHPPSESGKDNNAAEKLLISGSAWPWKAMFIAAVLTLGFMLTLSVGNYESVPIPKASPLPTDSVPEVEASPAAREALISSPIWPREATQLKPISLSDLVAKALPSSRQLSWDDLQISNVLWLTEGIDYSETGLTSRLGLVRARPLGKVSRVLRQGWEELSWRVEMSTDGNSKWGPTSIFIKPGFDTKDSGGKYICFGEGFQGCTFPKEALNGPNLKLQQICEIGSGGGESIAMKATTSDGRNGTVVYSGSGGSGGWANSVEISILNPLEYCDTNRDRGY